jgi:hypothetical protein
MKIIGKGYIPKPMSDKDFNSNAFPGICILPSGRWLASFKASEKKGDCDFMHAVMTWSDDNGKTWISPFEPIKLPDINSVQGQSRIMYFLSLGNDIVLMVVNWVESSDLSAPYYDPKTETLKDTRIFFCLSTDNGQTWNNPELMNTYPEGDPAPLTGPPFKLKDGTIVCQYEINKAVGDTSVWVHRSAMIFSHDGGNTWGEPVIVTEKPGMYYWDQRPNVMLDDRTVIDFFWTLDGAKNQYQNIHARQSVDGGRSWSEIFDTGIYGQPGQPVDIGDGRLATIDIDRTFSPVITVRTSRGLGRSYEESLVIFKRALDKQDSRNISMNDAWDEMVRFSVGHPNLVRINDREIMAYYYAGDHCDDTHIEYVLISVA